MAQGDAQDRMAGRQLLLGMLAGALGQAGPPDGFLKQCDVEWVQADDGEVVAIDIQMASGKYRLALLDLPPDV